MRSEPHITKAMTAKIEAMKKIKAAYLKAKENDQVKSYRVSPQ
ncbi:MAG: hypothetical protein ACI8WB_005780 [Phenylobacterium sp.]|jgi:hypothetical protein